MINRIYLLIVLSIIIGSSVFAQQNAFNEFNIYNYTKAIDILLSADVNNLNKKQLFGLAMSHFKRAELSEAFSKQQALVQGDYNKLIKEKIPKLKDNQIFKFYEALSYIKKNELEKARQKMQPLSQNSNQIGLRSKLWLKALKAANEKTSNLFLSYVKKIPVKLRNEARFITHYLFDSDFETGKNETTASHQQTAEHLAYAAWSAFNSGQLDKSYTYLNLLYENNNPDVSIKVDDLTTIKLYSPLTYTILSELDYLFTIYYFEKIENKNSGSNQNIVYNTGKVYYAIKKFQKAKTLFKKANNQNAQIYQAACLMQMGKKNEAKAIWNKIAQTNNPAILRELGYVMSDLPGEQVQAERFARKALESEIRDKGRNDLINPLYFQKLGWIQYKSGKFSKALATLKNGYDHTNHNNLDLINPQYILDFNTVRYRIGRNLYADILGGLYALEMKYPIALRLLIMMQYIYTPEGLEHSRTPTL